MFIKLKKPKRAIIGSDIHGNLNLFNFLLNQWKEACKEEPDTHFIIAGDVIHGRGEDDKTLEILEEISKYIDEPNFHILLGNHELTQIDPKSPLYKNMVGFRRLFQKCLVKKYGKQEAHKHKKKYYNIMKKFKYALCTDSGLWVSHTGPAHRNSKYLISEFMWNTIEYDDYNTIDINNFLENYSLKFMVVGHTEIPKGYQFVGNQVIINSSNHSDKNRPRYYLDIDLTKEINKSLIKKSLILIKFR